MSRLQNKVAIVTGAARGQGAAEARLFAAHGAKVAITDVNDDDGRKTAREIGANALFIHHDVADEDSWANVVSATLAAFGKINILINNAGVYKPRTFQETDKHLLDFHYRVNVVGTFLGMQAVYRHMIDAGGGAIVNVSSGAGMRGYPGLFAYAGSKWMVRGLGKCAAVDLATSNVRINTILPGLIDTPMLGENSKEQLEYLKNLPPVGRLGTVDDIAEAALYLASDAAAYVTGTELTVCGGLMA